MEETVKVVVGDKTFDYPVTTGSEQEKAFDITKLRSDTSYITFDNGYGNTGACTSAITFLDGEKGVLRYRGYPIEQLAENASFIETACLLNYGELPKKDDLNQFSRKINTQLELPKGLDKFLQAYPKGGHPMGYLSAAISSLSGYFPKLTSTNPSKEEIDKLVPLLIAQMNTIAATAYRKIKNKPFIKPRKDLDYVSNFLHMMFASSSTSKAIPDKTMAKALDALLILHADHEQNCSTSTVRLVGSSHANLFASIAGGVNALWGPLHGGANQEVVEMLEDIKKAGGNIDKFIAMAKDHSSGFRLMGVGHRVYKNFDPRATIIKKRCHELFDTLGVNDPLLEIAVKLEAAVLKDSYFVERKLYPNVDFYSGLIYRVMGIPTEMFTVMFALGRLPGWVAHWKEMRENPKSKIGRPRQVYTGYTERNFIPIEKRS
jgi:citrate synthase